jgi:hypothetical protein
MKKKKTTRMLLYNIVPKTNNTDLKFLFLKVLIIGQEVVVHTFNPSTWKAEKSKSLSLRTTCCGYPWCCLYFDANSTFPGGFADQE